MRPSSRLPLIRRDYRLATNMRPPLGFSSLRFHNSNLKGNGICAQQRTPVANAKAGGIEQRATISELFLTAIERELNFGRRDAHAPGRLSRRTSRAAPHLGFFSASFFSALRSSPCSSVFGPSLSGVPRALVGQLAARLGFRRATHAARTRPADETDANTKRRRVIHERTCAKEVPCASRNQKRARPRLRGVSLHATRPSSSSSSSFFVP